MPYARAVRRALIALVLAACAPRAFGPDDDRAVRAVIDAQRDAWNRGDLAAYMDGYARTDELVFTSGGKIRRGWAETFAKYQAKYGGSRETMGHLDFAILAVQPLGADGAIVLGRWRLTDTPAAGAGVFSVAFVRTQAGWRIVHDHTSLDGP
jgi:ketosteroid isomerase-like protein